jgi:hypothetical protein
MMDLLEYSWDEIEAFKAGCDSLIAEAGENNAVCNGGATMSEMDKRVERLDLARWRGTRRFRRDHLREEVSTSSSAAAWRASR